jgi:hypothetical protein
MTDMDTNIDEMSQMADMDTNIYDMSQMADNNRSEQNFEHTTSGSAIVNSKFVAPDKLLRITGQLLLPAAPSNPCNRRR